MAISESRPTGMKWVQKAIRRGEVVARRPFRLDDESDGAAATQRYLDFLIQNHADVLESVRAELEASGQRVDALLDQLKQARSLEEVRRIGQEMRQLVRWARSLSTHAA